MDSVSESRGLLSVGLLCTGALVLVRHALLVGGGYETELTAWLLAGTLPDRMIEAMILGVVASALVHRAPGPGALAFNAAVLSWAVAGLPRPDVGDKWPLALMAGLGLACGVSLGARWSSRALGSIPAVILAALVGLGGPALLLGRVPAPTWEVDGAEVHPTRARPDAPALALVVLDGVGTARADPRAMPALATLARAGTRFTHAVAAAPTREAALGSLLGPQPQLAPKGSAAPSLAEALAREGFATALFGSPRVSPAAGYRVTDLSAMNPEASVERAALWLQGVAGARFLLTVVIDTDAPSAVDLRDSDGDHAAAGLRAADRALGILLAHLSAWSLDQTTVVAVVGTVEAGEPASLRQAHLLVPVLVAGPGLPAGRTTDVVVETLAVAPTLGLWGGLAEGVDLLDRPTGEARYQDGAGGRGVRQGGWTLWLDADGQEHLHQVESDPAEYSNLADELPDRVEALRVLIDL